MDALLDHPEPLFVAAAIFAFLVLVFVKARTNITSMLDGKIDAIRNELDDARKLHEDARALLAEYEKKRNNAATDSEQMVVHAEAEAARAIEDAKAQLEDQLTRRVATAKERIAQAEAAAMQGVRNAAVDVAISAAEQLIKSNLDGAKQTSLAQVAIKDAAEKLH